MTEHDIHFMYCDYHKGDYWYKCSKCGAKDWIAGYGNLAQLDFYNQPCNSEDKIKEERKEVWIVQQFDWIRAVFSSHDAAVKYVESIREPDVVYSISGYDVDKEL